MKTAMPKSKEFVSGTYQDRLKRIKNLVEWIQAEKQNVLQWLNRERRTLEYESDVAPHFIDLPKETKETVLARYIRHALRYQIFVTYGFCESTVKGYVKQAMHEIGCRFYRNRWRCPIDDKST